MSPSISVIVPVRDGASTIEACLDGLEAQTVVDHEVIVVDDGSSDGSGDIARSHPSRPRVLRTAGGGSYAARNRGLAEAGGRVVAFTDADCVPRPTWLAAGTTCLEHHDLVGGAIEPLVDEPASLWARFDAAVYLDQQAMVEWGRLAATANLLVSRHVLDAVGAFDSTLRSSGDAELTQRAVAAGFDLGYCADAVVGHRCRATAAETWRLHHRLGRGWEILSARGLWPAARHDAAMRLATDHVRRCVEAQGGRLDEVEMRLARSFVLAARWAGRLSARVDLRRGGSPH